MDENNSLVQNLNLLNHLPKTWQVLPFSKVISDVSGGNKKTKKGDLLENGLIEVIDQGKELIAGYTDDKASIVKTKGPHIVFGDHTRIIKYIDFPFAMGADGTKVLKAKKAQEVIEKYIYYFFLTLNIPNTGYNRHFKYLKQIQIPLPPLETQKKIAAILDEADKLRQLNKQLITKYETLTQSLFLDMFGDPVVNPKGFESIILSKLISKLNTGVSVNSTDDEFSEDSYCILKTSCVYSGKFRPNEAKVIRKDEYSRMKLNPKKNSIIISRMNTTELVGKSAYIDRNYLNLFIPDRLWQTEKTDLPHNVIWLSMAISFPSFMREIGKISSGTSGSMKNISKNNFLQLPVIYPKFSLQNQFAERVQAIENQKIQAQEALQKSEDLFNSLLQKAFKGELVK